MISSIRCADFVRRGNRAAARPSSTPTPRVRRAQDTSAPGRDRQDMGLYGLDIPPEFGGPGCRYRHADADRRSRSRSIAPASTRPATACSAAPGSRSSTKPTTTRSERYLFPMLRGEKRGFFGSPSHRAAPTRRGRSGPPRRPRRRRLGDQRLQDLHHRRGRRRFRHRLRPHRRHEGPRRHHLLHRRCRHAGVLCPPRRAHAALRHYGRSCSSRTSACRAANVLGEVNKGFAIANDRVEPPAHPVFRRLHRRRHRRPGDVHRLRQAARDLRRAALHAPGDPVDGGRQRDRSSARRAGRRWRGLESRPRGQPFSLGRGDGEAARHRGRRPRRRPRDADPWRLWA